MQKVTIDTCCRRRVKRQQTKWTKWLRKKKNKIWRERVEKTKGKDTGSLSSTCPKKSEGHLVWGWKQAERMAFKNQVGEQQDIIDWTYVRAACKELNGFFDK